MPRVTNGTSGRSVDKAETRRSGLVQQRSRDTRRKLIRAALELWSGPDFEGAFEATTAEDIARAAGVSKGTFYFHFAHKEDILLEMSWLTAEIAIEEADAAMQEGMRTLDLVEQLMTSLARRVSRVPRPAVLRATSHWSRQSEAHGLPLSARSFGAMYERVVRYAAERGDLPRDVDVEELAALLQAATMDALVGWAATTQTSPALRDILCRRADVILCGAAVSYRR
jgi:AcrR family transcriptional regulator